MNQRNRINQKNQIDQEVASLASLLNLWRWIAWHGDRPGTSHQIARLSVGK